ncbi:yqaJ domain-containing protein [Nephila pilipes]|uniref:YqaJ domain-containing protein n=1 Tax=Nephila pilipes TaxID=299642 RepID=A0A8X6UCK7_NEPPI|nr:yqaJ domain-containing protein [Nephila pilipes]
MSHFQETVWTKDPGSKKMHVNTAGVSGCNRGILYEESFTYIAVRNRYCMACSRAAAVYKLPDRHCCSKYWHGSSSKIKVNIIQEGFQNSVAMYGMKYAKIIGDGDNNVYKTALDSRSYDELQMEKLECQNICIVIFAQS